MLNDGFFGLYKAECAAGLGENLALFWGRGGSIWALFCSVTIRLQSWRRSCGLRSDQLALMPAFLVIEDHPLTRRALADNLVRLYRTATVEVASDLEHGIDRAKRLPEGALVILDLGLPRFAGLASLRRLLAAVPHARVVIFSGADDPYTMVEARRLGARAFIPKAYEAEHFAEAIGAVLGGRLAFPPETLRISAGRLNAAEIEVLRVIARGVGGSRGEVGEALGVSERVIKRRLNNIYEKLGVSSRVEALARVRSLGISLGDG